MGIMAIYINLTYFSYVMAVVGGQGGNKVSYAKQDLKVCSVKGSWRSGEQRILESCFVCWFFTLPVVRDIILSTPLLWISFYHTHTPLYGLHGPLAA